MNSYRPSKKVRLVENIIWLSLFPLVLLLFFLYIVVMVADWCWGMIKRNELQRV